MSRYTGIPINMDSECMWYKLAIKKIKGKLHTMLN